MISLSDNATSVSVKLGEKVTVRIEEKLDYGFIWSTPIIEGKGLTLTGTRSLKLGTEESEYREFVFSTHRAGKNLVSASLQQVGFEQGVKEFFMVVEVVDHSESDS